MAAPDYARPERNQQAPRAHEVTNLKRFDRDRIPYVQIPNEMLADPSLSWKAKGLLCYLLSKPDNWQARNADLLAHATDGKDSMRAALLELEAAGYMAISYEGRSDDGRLTRTIVYSSKPVLDPDQADFPPGDGARLGGFPAGHQADFPPSDQADNPPLQRRRHTKKEKQEGENARAADQQFESFWSLYPSGPGNKGAKQAARKAWLKLGATDQQRAVDNLVNYNVGRGDQFVMHCSTYLSTRTGKGFDAYDERPDMPQQRTAGMSITDQVRASLASRPVQQASYERPDDDRWAGRLVLDMQADR